MYGDNSYYGAYQYGRQRGGLGIARGPMGQPGAPGGFSGANPASNMTMALLRYLSNQQAGVEQGPLDPQLYVHGIGSGVFDNPDRPVYLPGFRAPSRRLFARRGYRGPLYPGDQMVVGEQGPEVITTQQPTSVRVTPNDVLRRRLSGANPAPGAADALTSFQRGDQPAYAYNNPGVAPSARNEIMSEARAGANPYRRRIASQSQPNPERLRQANYDLALARRGGETDDQFRQRLMDSGFGGSPEVLGRAMEQKFVPKQDNSTEAITQRRAETNARRTAAGLPSLDEKAQHSKDVQVLIRTRSAERRAAVEEFGTDRPRAIGALRERNRQRGIQEATIAASLQSKYGVTPEQAAKIARDMSIANKNNAEADISKRLAGSLDAPGSVQPSPGQQGQQQNIKKMQSAAARLVTRGFDPGKVQRWLRGDMNGFTTRDLEMIQEELDRVPQGPIETPTSGNGMVGKHNPYAPYPMFSQ